MLYVPAFLAVVAVPLKLAAPVTPLVANVSLFTKPVSVAENGVKTCPS